MLVKDRQFTGKINNWNDWNEWGDSSVRYLKKERGRLERERVVVVDC